jgi:hypothetical protein
VSKIAHSEPVVVVLLIKRRVASQAAAGLTRSPAEYLNVGKTPEQCCCDDQDYGDHTEICEFLSSRREHFRRHLEFCLELLRYDFQSTMLAQPLAV